MLPVTLTTFKKSYNFLWQLSITDKIVSTVAKNIKNLNNVQEMVGLQLLFSESANYVSQLAQSIDLPDDEIEMKDYKIGNTTISVPTNVKMNPITVTYLDDSLGSVYKFHKTWQSYVRSETSMNFKELVPLCASGLYIQTDKSFTPEVYNTLINNKNSVNDLVIDGLSIRSTNIYPLLFPKTISRGTQDKSSDSLGTVRVTYIRLPNITKPKSIQYYYNGYWFNSKPVTGRFN